MLQMRFVLALLASITIATGCGDGTTNPMVGSYALDLSAPALTITQGGAAPTTVNLTRTDFTGEVTLTFENAPAGVTGSFNPSPANGSSSVLTVSVDATVAAGTYAITIRGSAANLNDRTATLTLTVSATPDYSLSLSPTALTIAQGTNAPTVVTIARTNFTGAVTLSLGGAPAGITGVFNPAAPTGNGSTLTVTVGAAVAPGVYNLTVDGTAAAGDHSTPLTVTVGAAPDYSLTLAPAALTIVQGANAPSTVTLTRTNFTGAVTLGLGGAPAGVTGAFSPAVPTGTSSTLTVTVGAAVAAGTYNLTVDGTATAGNRSTPLTLTVTAAAANYSLSLSPAAFSIAPGANAPTTVTIARTNFTGAVTLSLGNAPAGVTGVFNPAAPTGTSSTLTVTVGAAVAAGVYNLTVDGTGAPGNRSTPLTLTVTIAADYSLSLNPAALTVVQGSNAPTAVTLTRSNFTGAITLSLGSAPAGVTGVFNPAAPTGTSSTLTVTVGAAVAPGVYNLTVDGTGTPGNRSTPLTLTVSAAPDYVLSINPTALSIVQGANAPTIVTIARTNFTGAVTLSLGGAPAGVTGAFSPAAPTGTSSTLTVTVGAAVAAGVYNLTVDGTGAPGNRSTPLTLTVTAAPNYSLAVSPTALTIAQGANAPTTVTITRTNFTGAVTLSLGGAPAGVTGVFNPAAPTGTSSTLTVTVGAAVAAGNYNLTVDGTGTPGNRSTPLTLTVTAASNYSLSLNPAALTIDQGANAPTTVTIARTNFTGAVTLSLSGAPAGVTGVFSPTAPTGTSSTLTLTVGGAVTPGVYNLTVNGTGTPGNRSTPLTLTVNTSGGGGAITWDFSGCPVNQRPVWLAAQDGSGPWTVVTPVNNVYSYNFSSNRGGLTYVLNTTTSSDIEVYYSTKAETGNSVFCPPAGTTKTVNGTVAGVGASEAAFASLGGGVSFVYSFLAGFPNFQITSVASGAQDLVGSHEPSFTAMADKAIIRRGLNIANNGSIGATLDFSGVEAFPLDNATITLSGLLGTETASQNMTYQVAGCQGGPLYTGVAVAGASFTAAGVPAAQQLASDFHGLSVIAGNAGGTETRDISLYFHTFGPRTITLPAVFPTPTITALGGPYKRLQAAYTLPTDYDQRTSFNYTDQVATSKSVSISASIGYLGGTAVTLGLADYSGLAGWDNNWAPASANTADWTASGIGGAAVGGYCTEGASLRYGSARGSN
jgi:hypothetical protein